MQPEAEERFLQMVYGTVDLDLDGDDAEPDDGTEEDVQKALWGQPLPHTKAQGAENPLLTCAVAESG